MRWSKPDHQLLLRADLFHQIGWDVGGQSNRVESGELVDGSVSRPLIGAHKYTYDRKTFISVHEDDFDPVRIELQS